MSTLVRTAFMPDSTEIQDETPETAPSRSSAAGTVAFGIFASRIVGFVREKVVFHFFGVSAFTDVYQAAFRGPNLLQNLLGEATLSAAFIPIYSRMLEEGREEDAGRFAGAIFGLLLAVAAAFVLAGVLLAEPIVTVLVGGFLDDAEKVAAGELPVNRFALAVDAVRIIFPMTGLLVLSAWALGILNSHRRFFVPYIAPVLWNVAIIGGMVTAAFMLIDNPFAIDSLSDLPVETLTNLLFAAFWGALLGGALQFGVQLPVVARVLRGFRPSLSTDAPGVREAIGAFGPVVAGRGVYQVSSYLDVFLASWLAAGALAALRPAQMLYTLPVSLFGLSVAATELPELSRIREEELRPFLHRLDRSLRQTLFLTIPTIVGYLFFGYLIVGAIFRGGAFGPNDNWLVYLILGGYSLGLMATTISRLLQNGFYALQDTKTPAKIAVARVAISTAVAVPLMFWLNQYPVAETVGFAHEGPALYLGAVGLAVGSTAGAWIELWRLFRALHARLESFRIPWGRIVRMVAGSLAAAVPAAALWWWLQGAHMGLMALAVVGVYGTGYLALAYFAGAPEVEAWTGRFLHRFRDD